ncbi:SdpA family antimicrobial peptide system protein [Microbacterium suaedae]|uniref:SdpA family antimicrobial peptide system protein n=1 Tax=Microbacterium suaedae TaxID=2067813 RepID=UPI0013A60411|nr:SdpA family antimicrobial peptide system protein [Microbacterium suaedae]
MGGENDELSNATNDETVDNSAPQQAAEGSAMIRNTVLVATLLIVAVIAVTSLPAQVHTPRSWNGGLAVVQSVVPQGWGFFTRDPREPSVTPYTEGVNNEWVNAKRGPNVQPQYAFGANREGRLTEFDVEGVVSGAEGTPEWVSCGTVSELDCIAQTLESGPILASNVAGYDLRLCERIALIREDPVPLSYARFGGKPELSGMILDVDCELLS